MYDPRLGRWLAIDPVFSASQSTYSFVKNNPLFLMDPNGQNGEVTIQTNNNGKKTLIISATYHYIEGAFDETILAAVASEFNNKVYKNINYDEEKVTVKFDIKFESHPVGADLSQYNGSGGQNELIEGNTGWKDSEGNYAPEVADFQSIQIDMSHASNYSYYFDDHITYGRPNPEAEGLSPSQIIEYNKGLIMHGIGHNLGMIHADNDLMNDKTGLQPVLYKDFPTKGDLDGRIEFSKNGISKSNVQALISRVQGMTENPDGYWKGKTEVDSYTKKTVDISDTGVTIIKKLKNEKNIYIVICCYYTQCILSDRLQDIFCRGGHKIFV